jgi:hypothetical protein
MEDEEWVIAPTRRRSSHAAKEDDKAKSKWIGRITLEGALVSA